VLAVSVPVCLPSVFFLDPAGIRQHQLTQFGGAGGAKHRAFEALFHQAGNVADVIQVRVREDDRIDGSCRNWEVLPVP
jgi:hypothetical protein